MLLLSNIIVITFSNIIAEIVSALEICSVELFFSASFLCRSMCHLVF